MGGGLTITALSAPGHTPGTVNFIVPVTYKGQAHKLAYWGGSGFPATAAVGVNYLRSVESMYALVKKTGADGSINSHTFFDHSGDRIDQIRAQGGIANSNPMIQGNAKILLSYTALRACAGALLYSRDATAQTPVWRPTQTEFYTARFNPASGMTIAKAHISNFFNVISGGTVKFTTAQGSSCSATSDEDGIDSCVMRTSAAPGEIKAEFIGMAGADAIELSSTDKRTVTQ